MACTLGATVRRHNNLVLVFHSYRVAQLARKYTCHIATRFIQFWPKWERENISGKSKPSGFGCTLGPFPMQPLNLKPTHKLVKNYYQALGQFGQLNIDHEMAVRDAF